MTLENQAENLKPLIRALLKRVWGAFPILVLLIITIVLSGAIKAKTDKLEAMKAGVAALSGQRMAAENIDRVVGIIKSSKDQNDAIKKLAAQLKVTPDAAKAIVHMPLNALVKFQRTKLDRQIAYVNKQIAAHKLEVAPQAPDINVVSLKLQPETIQDRINLPGVVEPWVKFNIVAEVRGEVKKKLIEKGVSITKGDIIALLDTRDYEIALQAAKASYDTALSSMKRLDKLYKEQLASRSQIDDITAQVERFKAQFDSATLNLERCTIRSPISGIINDLYFEKGQYVNISDPVAEVLQMDKVKISVGIPESDVNAMNSVTEFDVKFDALEGRSFCAAKYFLSKSSDAQARLYKLELEMDNASGEILPDMFARVEIVKREVLDALSVPIYSIITLNDEQTVYVVKGNAAHARKVKIGIQEGWRIEIKEGLDVGDQVIVVGQRRVSDGQEVNVIRTLVNIKELAN